MTRRRPVAWVTLTSAPGTVPDRLRRDFQAWRKRLARSLGIPEADLEYAMVDTSEGHGVLHLCLAFPAGSKPWFDFNRAGEWWQEIHGARQVKFKWVGKGDGDVRRLSTYLISQYMTAQGEVLDLLGRFSQSRIGAPLAAWRRQVFAIVASRLQAYRWAHQVTSGGPCDFPELWRDLRRLQFRTARRCWDQLLSLGWFDHDGVTYAICGSQRELLPV
jgi:hypothetical protein